MKLLALLIVALFLQSCGWTDSQEVEFMKHCEDGMVRGIAHGNNGMVDREAVHRICSCAFERVKEKWSYTEFIEMQDNAPFIEMLEQCAE
jgi:hypothetical protein